MKTRHQRIVLMAVTVAVAAATWPASSQTRVQVKDCTTALLKALSPADAYHATLFDGLGQFHKLLDSLASVDTTDPPATAAPGLATRDLIRQAACETDTAFLGAVTEATSHPTRDGLFLWTSYRVRIVKSLRSRTGAMPQTGIVAVAPPTGIITVVRPGGSMVIEGMTVAARSNSYPPLEVGEQYYFFASFLDQTRAYKSSNRSGAFHVDGKSVRLLGLTSDERLKTGIPVDEFEASLRALTCAR